MGMKEILERIKKLENKKPDPCMVTLIYRIDGKEIRKSMDIQEATQRVMEQASKVLFCGELTDNCIVGVEEEDGDGFLESLIDTEPIKNIDDIVEV